MEIQERIINEAGQLFARYGIRGVTMDSIAEDMGISKRTIYENFKDKDTLLMEVILFYKKIQTSNCEKIFKESSNVIEALYKLIESMVNTMKQVNPLFFQDMKKYHTQTFNALYSKGSIRDHTMTKQILTEGVKQNIFRSDLNMEIINLSLHELFNLFSPENQMTREGYHRGELFDNIIIPYLRGISTNKGVELIDKQGISINQGQ